MVLPSFPQHSTWLPHTHTHVILLPHPVSIHLPVCGLHPQSSFRSPPLLTPPGLPCRSKPSHRSLLNECGASSLVSPLLPLSLFSLFSTRQLEGAFEKVRSQPSSAPNPAGRGQVPAKARASGPTSSWPLCLFFHQLLRASHSPTHLPRTLHWWCFLFRTPSLQALRGLSHFLQLPGRPDSPIACSTAALPVSPYPALLGTHTTHHLQYSALPPHPLN